MHRVLARAQALKSANEDFCPEMWENTSPELRAQQRIYKDSIQMRQYWRVPARARSMLNLISERNAWSRVQTSEAVDRYMQQPARMIHSMQVAWVEHLDL